MKKFLGIDIGGGSIKATLTDREGQILEESKLQTNPNWENHEFLENLASLISSFLSHSISGIGIGSPGPIDIERGIIHYSANLVNLKDVHLVSYLQERFSLPVFLNNDANCAALGEYYFGAGQGVENLLVFTLGTGLGAGWVWKGELFNGYMGNGMELGHTTVVMDGALCGCGKRGCAESYFSARGLLNRYEEKSGVHLDSAYSFFELVRKKEPLAVSILEFGVRVFAECIRNVVHTINPEKIILLGGLTASYDLFEEKLKTRLQEIIFSVLYTRLKIELGGKVAGSLGAASLAF
jgi:glucokinase